MNRLRFEVKNNQGCFIFPETWYESRLEKFDELLDAFDEDELSDRSYINALKHITQQEPDFIDAYAYMAYAFLEQETPRKALNIALKGLAAGI